MEMLAALSKQEEWRGRGRGTALARTRATATALTKNGGVGFLSATADAMAWAMAWHGVSKGNGGSVSKNRRRGPLAGGSDVGRRWRGQLACLLLRLWPAEAQAHGGPPKMESWIPCQQRSRGDTLGGVGVGDLRMCVCPAAAHRSAGARLSGWPWQQQHGRPALGVGG